jgi:Fic-DOC domain mobile mystery protein B
LLDDTKYWIDNGTFNPDEMAIRFKHRIVSIHCFANGNGRHSRLMADIIIEKVFKQPVFTWGAANLIKQGDTRSAYLTAIKAADAGNINLLVKFARS